MKRLLIVLSLCISVLIYAHADEVADSLTRHQSVGLVLSGGGAKGIAHIGVIKALEENNIPIDYVAGTSMGAIVGSLYACGYTPDEMLALIATPEFTQWSTGTVDERLTYYFSKPAPTPALLNISVQGGDSIHPAPSILPHSVINPMPMNFGFMQIFSGYTAQCGGNFNNLFVPFRCVASDVIHKHKVVFSDGLLEDAVRASMSFPIVFRPIEVNGVPLYDGGIYDNFPVDVMRRDFAPSVIIGVDVHTPDTGVPSNDIMNQLESMIIQNNDYELPADEGIKIHVDASKYSLLDFDKASRISALGYDKAMEMMDSIKNRIYTRVPAETRLLRRQVYKCRVPYVRFDSINVSGGTEDQNRYLEYLFKSQEHGDTLGIAGARIAFYRALSPGRLSNFLPTAHYDAASGLFRLDLKASVKDGFNCSAGGYITSSTNSMLYLGAGYNSLSFKAVTANLGLWLGQSYLAASFTGDMTLPTVTPSSIGVQATVFRQSFNESDRMFFRGSSPTFVSNLQTLARARWQIACGSSAKAALSLGYGMNRHSFYPGVSDRRQRTRFDIGQLAGRYVLNTLDNMTVPTSGIYLEAEADGRTGRYRFDDDHNVAAPDSRRHYTWMTGKLDFRAYSRFSRHFALGWRMTGAYSSLPLLDTYYASVVNAPGFYPTPSSYNAFNTMFHANEYVTAGIVLVWMLSQNMQVRGELHAFMPMRRICADFGASDDRPYYGKWFDPDGLEFFGELQAVYSLPFASLTAYANYRTGSHSDWNCGISFGLFILAPHL